jgi:type IV pilus assembly protein PilE
MLRSAKRTLRGITLVELMVVIAILAILATIGYPMYVEQVQKGRRVDARSGVMEIALAMEKEFAAWGQYSEPTATIAGISATDGTPAPDANSNFHANLRQIAELYTDYYNFTITAGNANDTFIVTATPTGIQADDTKCAFLSVNQVGVKTATDVDLCW